MNQTEKNEFLEPALIYNQVEKKEEKISNIVTEETDLAVSDKVEPADLKKDSTTTDTKIVNQAKNKKETIRKSSRFGFSVSAGPDISMVGLYKTGKTNLNYGAGLSYDLSKKLSVRAGFYVAKKIYIARPEDYHPPKNYWTNYIDLKSVEANCNVFEIPVIIDYHFISHTNYTWFGSLGISSLLMDRETYGYNYKSSTGQYMYRSWTVKDKNKHFFSVLSISGGYSYKLNEVFSLRAEPYLKIPLTGIGFGKVELNSAGILFSLGIKPLKQKQQRNK